MASTVANRIKLALATKLIDFSADSFKIILMVSGFTFNKDTHHGYADVSASELATGNGYTANTKTLAGVTVTEDDTDDRTEVTWNSVTWTASGGDIGPTPGAIIFDDTAANDPIVGYIDFGGDQTQTNGGIATIANIEFRLA
jgi:hypothetical protein